MRFSNTLMLLCCIGLCACSATGLDAQKSFSCKAPVGIGCSSLSGVYANALANNLPGSATGKQTTVYSKSGSASREGCRRSARHRHTRVECADRAARLDSTLAG